MPMVKIEFDVTLIPYKGNDSWVEKAVIDAHKCLNRDSIPKSDPGCDYCSYRETAKELER